VVENSKLDQLPSKCWYYREFITQDWEVDCLKGELGKYAQQRCENLFEKKLVEKYPRAAVNTEEPLKGYRLWCIDRLAEKM
jgi:hypothetical protein